MRKTYAKKGTLLFLTSMLISNLSFGAPTSTGVSNATAVSGLSEAKIDGTAKSTLIGAGVGTLSSKTVGQYMNNQESELRQQTLENMPLNGGNVVRDGDRIHLFLPAATAFNKNNADINSDLSHVLDTIAIIEKKYNSTVIHITGNSDASESNQNNIGLKRANNVVAYLQYKGIPYERLQSSSNGARNAIASNDNEKGRKLNRRVDITLIPLTQ